MPDVADAYEYRPADARDAQTMIRISTGPVAGKQRFVSESFERRTVIGAYNGERLVGYAIWDRAFFGRPFVWLLGVDPVYRRRGVAARLMCVFETQCTGESLFTSTNESNAAMHGLLAGLGFVRSGSVDNLDPGDPEIFYYKQAVRR